MSVPKHRTCQNEKIIESEARWTEVQQTEQKSTFGLTILLYTIMLYYFIVMRLYHLLRKYFSELSICINRNEQIIESDKISATTES